MNQVTKSLSREELARVEARNAEAKTLQEAVAKQPPRFVGDGGRREMVVSLDFLSSTTASSTAKLLSAARLCGSGETTFRNALRL